MNVGIALALDYKKEDILPFLNSYEKNSSGILYLITNNVDQYANYSKIKTIDIFVLAKQYNINLSCLTVFNLKPVLFYLFLKTLKNKCTNALLTDVDIVFQQDPFLILDEIKTDSFIICEECVAYKDNDTNTTWFNAGYHEEYESVKNQKVLNCGVAIGKYDAVLDYQKQVAKELEHILAVRPYFAYDQVILNLLTYSRKTLNPTILPHNTHFISHMHFLKDEDLTNYPFKDGVMYSPDNKPYIVIHQFNENKIINNFIYNTWKY